MAASEDDRPSLPERVPCEVSMKHISPPGAITIEADEYMLCIGCGCVCHHIVSPKSHRGRRIEWLTSTHYGSRFAAQ
jgi:hypothetical protein